LSFSRRTEELDEEESRSMLAAAAAGLEPEDW
jgi:hypothetical protein